jgi:hypothetical protein
MRSEFLLKKCKKQSAGNVARGAFLFMLSTSVLTLQRDAEVWQRSYSALAAAVMMVKLSMSSWLSGSYQRS